MSPRRAGAGDIAWVLANGPRLAGILGACLEHGLHGIAKPETLLALPVVLPLIGAPTKATLVDVGSGLGPYSVAAARSGLRTVSIDMDPRRVSCQREASVPCGNSYQLLSDARFLPIRTGSADRVVAFQTLEHVREDGQVLAELARVLRPEGTAIITTPYADSPEEWGAMPHLSDHVRSGYNSRYLGARLGATDLVLRASLRYGNGLSRGLVRVAGGVFGDHHTSDSEGLEQAASSAGPRRVLGSRLIRRTVVFFILVLMILLNAWEKYGGRRGEHILFLLEKRNT